MTQLSPTEPGPQPPADDLFRRLRAWPVSSWRHRDRLAAARRAAQTLADLAADGEHRSRRVVPELPEFALADQLTVLYRDAQVLDSPAADRVLTGLAADLGFG